LAFFSANVSHSADCEKALFGWTASDGTHIQGILANEGVSKKNPRGYQNKDSDPGNFRNGKNCGGTAFGIACASNPSIDVKYLTRGGAIKYYHNNQWSAIYGDDLISQYLAYKMMDLSVNMGVETAIILLEKAINDLNGKDDDYPLSGHLNSQMIKWVNDFTAPEKLADGTVSHYRRWCFFAQLKINALSRYGNLITKNRKLAQFWATWRDRTTIDQ